MFGGGSSLSVSKSESSSTSGISTQREKSPEKETAACDPSATSIRSTDGASGTSGENRLSDNGSPTSTSATTEQNKRLGSGVSARASNLIDQAKNTLSTQVGGHTQQDSSTEARLSLLLDQTPLQELGRQDQTLAVPQGFHNNAAGESLPGPKSTFKVGVWEDRNKKCRRTMEDTHAFLYNFLHTLAPVPGADGNSLKSSITPSDSTTLVQDMLETDNGYFAVFDGHAGTFAADWCGKKLHMILEDMIRCHSNMPMPELLDMTFTAVDAQLEKLPLKNSGCTAAVAVLRWEDRVPSRESATGTQAIAPAVAQVAELASRSDNTGTVSTGLVANSEKAYARLKNVAARQRTLYTANVGDARIILCRSGKALRLSYDHKGSDELEGKRIQHAGGLIMNSRVNGVLAVTRALGDSYIKELVTGHPYTTETVIQPELDEFIIIACDGLWDVCSDQEAVDLVRTIQNPVSAAKLLVDHALSRFSTDNLSCMIIRFDRQALLSSRKEKYNSVGVENYMSAASPSEAGVVASSSKNMIAVGNVPAVGVVANNSDKVYEPGSIEHGDVAESSTLVATTIEELIVKESMEQSSTAKGPESSRSTSVREVP